MFQMKDELKKFILTVHVTKVDDNLQKNDTHDTVDISIACDGVTTCDEIFTNVALACFNSNVTLECRILTIYPFTPDNGLKVFGINQLKLERKSTPYLVGHRGLGHDPEMVVQENTIHGFNRCAELGMDFVELDVHFTKDEEIIVFHDYFMDADNFGQRDEIRLLTHEEIYSKLESVNKTRLLPTLNKVMTEVSENIGILIEMKYPLLRCDGTRENESQSSDPNIYYMQKNDYVDKILKTVIKNLSMKPRKLVLISFDPDICLMVKLKQSLCPVFCITRGDLLDGVINHADNRVSHYKNAASWAAFCGFNGIVCRYHEQLTESYKDLKDGPLLTFLYGQFPRSEQFFRDAYSSGLDGFIIDGVEDYLRCLRSS